MCYTVINDEHQASNFFKVAANFISLNKNFSVYLIRLAFIIGVLIKTPSIRELQETIQTTFDT